MDKIATYRSILKKEFQRLAALEFIDQPGLKHHLVINSDEADFILLVTGWDRGEDYEYGVVYHVEIKDGKVWIHEDNTDYAIGDRLEELGIPPEDIICVYMEPDAVEKAMQAA